MLKKISAAFIFFALFVLLSGIGIWIAANIIVSSQMTKMFVTGNLSRIINSAGGGDVSIDSIKLSLSKQPSIIFNDVKLYGKFLSAPLKKSASDNKIPLTPYEARAIVFACDKVIILPDYLSFVKGKRAGMRQITITDGNLKLPSSKFTLKNLNLTLFDVDDGIISSVFGKTKRGEKVSSAIRNSDESQTPATPLKSDFTLFSDNKPLCDVSLEDGVVDFLSQELRFNKLSATLRQGDVKISDVKGVVKFSSQEEISYHLVFECGVNDIGKFLSNEKEVVNMLKMLKFQESQSDEEERFYVVISNKNILKSPTEISITPQNSGMKIHLTL